MNITIKNFSLAQTMDSGQSFRGKKLGKDKYQLVRRDKQVTVVQTGDVLCWDGDDELWIDYLDLGRDYLKIQKSLLQLDEKLQKPIEYSKGLRILRQDAWECLISFIISTNNSILNIRNSVEHLSQRYGRPISAHVYAFPEASALARVTEADLRSCKLGYRSNYVLEMAKDVVEGRLDLERISTYETDKLLACLTGYAGVGIKVASCVALFAYGRFEVFPVDTWIRKYMERVYPECIGQGVNAFARSLYGENAGYAQQVIFEYARMSGMK